MRKHKGEPDTNKKQTGKDERIQKEKENKRTAENKTRKTRRIEQWKHTFNKINAKPEIRKTCDQTTTKHQICKFQQMQPATTKTRERQNSKLRKQ